MSLSECIICCESENRDFRKITSKCTHQAVVCAQCVNNHIKSKTNEKQILEISCPMSNCGKIMERHEIKSIATDQVFENYDDLAFKVAVQKIPQFRWCKAPCGAGQIHIGEGKTPVVICQSCGAESCYTHNVPWHMEQTCEEYDENKKQSEFASSDYLSQKTKACPGCSAFIEKNEGCNHMTCIRCRHEFCWLCLQKHPLHLPTCRRT